MVVTRTLGPLHFEDLEPKRFEDLVRQLAYDFKRWRRLEATGRSGTDDGFDARGFEIVNEEPTEEENEDEACVIKSDRLWLIQCKRERTISPAKLSNYLDDIRLSDDEHLHGIVFTAACDFSKRSRDLFRSRCEALGIEEWHLWGKAELEDLLFQPRNDSLLFAYFGVSIAIRRRNQKSELRSKISMKRKAHRLLEEKHCHQVILRSPDAHQYPFRKDVPNFKSRPTWILLTYKGMHFTGLHFCIRRHFAYIDDEHKGWDAALVFDDAPSRDDPWNRKPIDSTLRQQIYEEWSALPRRNQAWLEVVGIVPYESIIEIDELGDDIIEAPHIYVPFDGQKGPFIMFFACVEPAERHFGGSIDPKDDLDRRISFFREEWRKRNPDSNQKDETIDD